jgi:hypothetical protein
MFAPKLAKAQRPKHGFLLHKNSRHKSSGPAGPCCPGTVLSHLSTPRHLKEPSSKVTSHGIVQAILHALNFPNTGGGSSGGDGSAAAPAEQQQRGGNSSHSSSHSNASSSSLLASSATASAIRGIAAFPCSCCQQTAAPGTTGKQPSVSAILTGMQTRVRRPQRACQDPAGI